MTDTNYLDNVNETGNVSAQDFILKKCKITITILIYKIWVLKTLYNWGINNCDGFQFDCNCSKMKPHKLTEPEIRKIAQKVARSV
jgi:hypothetical protein